MSARSRNRLSGCTHHSEAGDTSPERHESGSACPAPVTAADAAATDDGEEPSSYDQLEAILASSDDSIIVKSIDNRVLRWSKGAEQLYGYAAHEIVGKPVGTLFAPDHESEITGIMRRVAAGEEIHNVPTVRITKDGRRIDILLTVAPIRNASGRVTGTLSFTRDASERNRTDREIEELSANAASQGLLLEAARHVALDILSSRTGVEALRHIAEAARSLAGARYAALGVASADGKSLSEFVTVGLDSDQEAAIGPRPRGAGVLGVLLHRTDPLLIDEISAHPASVGFPANHPPMRSFLGVPIRRGDSALGSLYLTDKISGERFTESDAAAIHELGAHAAVAIHNLQMLQRQRSLVSGLINAQEEERRAVAYDLHDGLTQYVMGSHAHLEMFRHSHEAGQEDRAERELSQGLKYLKEAVLESRRLVNGLRSLALDDMGLAGALEQLVTEEKTRNDWTEAELVHNIAGRRFDKTLETAAYRIAQEALTNARKHAATSRVRVILLLDTGKSPGTTSLTVEVRDWGCGFDVSTQAVGHGHVGLQGMAERVSLLGGEYELASAPGKGATVRAVFPLIDAPAEREMPVDLQDSGEGSAHE